MRGETGCGRRVLEKTDRATESTERWRWYVDTVLVNDTGESDASMEEGEGEKLRCGGGCVGMQRTRCRRL